VLLLYVPLPARTPTQHTMESAGNDLVFEEQLVRTPYNLRVWTDFLDAKQTRPYRERVIIYERALKLMPGSYKLWHAYLTDRVRSLRRRVFTHPKYEAANALFERALLYMHKMPVIWTMFIQHLQSQHLVTRTRRTLDRALQALPVTQHERIWQLYDKFAHSCGVWQTCVHAQRRAAMFDRSKREAVVEYLLSLKRHGDAAVELSQLVSDPKFVSHKKKSKHQMWVELCELACKHPQQVRGKLDVDAVVRAGLSKFTEETGRLWCALADYYIILGEFERARDVYDEAIVKATTVRDFSTVFDAYAHFEEATLSAKMTMLEQEEEEEEEEGETVGAGEQKQRTDDDIDFRLARLEHLMDRRPLLLNAVRLRQNPNNVNEWQKRAALLKESGDLAAVINTFRDALATVNVDEAIGKPHTLWLSLAQLYEDHGKLDDAATVLARARKADFRKVDDLAAVWCASAEFELRRGDAQAARDLLKSAVQVPSSRDYLERQNVMRQLKAQNRTAELKELEREQNAQVAPRLHKSPRIWSMYVDLEEAAGTMESTREAYRQMIDLKIATPRTILNLATLLEERRYFEESFRAYERGIALFPWPHVYEIWVQYLTRFVARYGGSKLERARELFEQALKRAPKRFRKTFYMLYIDLEDKYGLIRHSLSLYDRAVDHVDVPDQLDMYRLYVHKVQQSFGVTKTRQVYERAIQNLDEAGARTMSLEFANTEIKLGEIDRARAILAYGAQCANPRVVVRYWEQWHQFEVEHGNEDTYRDMLRVKNTVAAQFGQNNINVSGEVAKDADTVDAAAAAGELEAIQRAKNARTAARSAHAAAGGITEFESDVAPDGAAGQKRSADEANLSTRAAADTQRAAPATVNQNWGEGGLVVRGQVAPPTAAAAVNSEEIDVEVDGGGGGGEDDQEEEDSGPDMDFETKAVPSAVFGDAMGADSSKDAPAPAAAVKLGARERLRAAGRG
jgi:pre-mRNA-splicing factor SYF1